MWTNVHKIDMFFMTFSFVDGTFDEVELGKENVGP